MATSTDTVNVAGGETAVEKKAAGFKERVQSGLGEAQKGLQQLEAGAQQALATLTSRVEATRASVLERVKKLEAVELRPEAALQAVAQRVGEVQALARKQLQELPGRLAEGAGLATLQQVKALQAELAELQKKLEASLHASGKKGAKSEGRAA